MGTKAAGDMCYDAAMPDEPMFILLARDKQAPELVRKWAKDREATFEQIWNGDAWVDNPKDEAERVKIAEARYCAARMEVWRYENDGAWRKSDAK